MTLERIKEVARSVKGKLNKFVVYNLPGMIDCKYEEYPIMSVTVKAEQFELWDESDVLETLARKMSETEEMLRSYNAILIALGLGRYNFDRNTIYLTDAVLDRIDCVLKGGKVEPILSWIIHELKCKIALVPFHMAYEQFCEKMKVELKPNFEKRRIRIIPNLYKEKIQLKKDDLSDLGSYEWLC